MDGYLLDTCAISALLAEKHKNHQAVKQVIDGIEPGASRFVSSIAIAEMIFGALTDEASTGQRRPKIWEVLDKAQRCPIREVTNNTRHEYANLRKNLAIAHLPNILRSDRSRWIENWMSKITGEKLQIEENDLWICAQAKEYNLRLITTDAKMVRAVTPADPDVRFLLVAVE